MVKTVICWTIIAILAVTLIVAVVVIEQNKGLDITVPLTEYRPPETTKPTLELSPWEKILTYKQYLEMTTEERNAFYDSFEDPDEFYAWFDEVQAMYEQRRIENQLGNGGSINMDDLINAG